ncbi:MAG: EF-P beta-lysylation protein EpmB [Gammaproteobacteria bacterium]|nr:EF-P beta-lysylation protein EpmB [Gammaproteobacteria bacterium]MBT8150903.1 EF-P beta-lysylation protein EpmB [Gammaproteobacteria bacterium]NNM11447.1 EF-P beta-lysylation protein EpmB [Pseudomonadales bacterium]RZV53738.1 MAG: EF-P beta-lysylation protein EpmB [Pseudomonadales bacterium]
MIPASARHRLTDNYIASSGVSGDSSAAARHKQSTAWQRELSAASITVAELLGKLGIPIASYRHQLVDSGSIAGFPLRVTASFINRMQPGNIDDPLLRQVLPRAEELLQMPGFSADPLAERDYNNTPGLIQKYASRALLVVTQACAIHCRYCFRKNFPYQDNRLGRSDWQRPLQEIQSDPSISEVILSGGDPLSLADQQLGELLEQIARIQHVDCLRIHTRLPVVLPSRVTRALLDRLEKWPGKLVVVVHSNHAAEMDQQVANALQALSSSGATLLNQAVLLRGVNDSQAAQIQLCRTLFKHGVLPYYLHQLDKVSGTSHFEVSDAQALHIHDAMRGELPGYLLPRLVREIPGATSKIDLSRQI